jgi:hypothetical protein
MITTITIARRKTPDIIKIFFSLLFGSDMENLIEDLKYRSDLNDSFSLLPPPGISEHGPF